MTVVDLATLPAAERVDYWREVICGAFVPLAPRQLPAAGAFEGRVDVRPFPRIIRARVASAPQWTTHGHREVARTDGEYVFINLQTAGTCAVEQGGRRSLLGPGQFTVVDSTEPFDTVFDGAWEMVTYRIPRDMVTGRLDALRRLTGGSWASTGAGSVVSAVMSSMWALDDAGPVSADLEQALVSALSAAVVERDGGPVDRHERLRAAIHREIETGLFDPDLTVGRVSRRLGVSSRTLHAAVGAGGVTFAATVRRRRLEHAARRLADSRSQATITEIAASVCFDGPASFSRAFRREFGRTPSEVRGSGHAPARTAQRSRTHGTDTPPGSDDAAR